MRYPDVLPATLQRVADDLGVDVTGEEQAAFGASVPDWPAFPDSAAALAALHERFRLIILSNIDRTSFAASARRLGVEFDLVITAEDVGSYKPSPANFGALLDRHRRHRAPARRPVPVPRPRAGQGGRPADRVDRPPPRPHRDRGDAGSRGR